MRLVQASCQDAASCARQRRADIATFLQTTCRLLQYRLQVVPPCKRSKSSLSSEADAGTALATECAQGVGNIGFVQPSHEPSSITRRACSIFSVAALRHSAKPPASAVRLRLGLRCPIRAGR